MEKLPAQSPCGAKLGYITADRARQLIRQRQAIGKGTKHKIDYVIILNAVVREVIPVGALKTVYRDDLGDTHHPHTLKRLVNGQLHKWHPELTFEDAKRGRVVPESVRLRRIEERRLKRTA